MAKKILKDKAWKVFALYIKLRDADGQGLCECCTCGKVLEFDSGDCQAGHFVAGRGGAVLYDSKVVHAQCGICNLWNNGEQAKYLLFMKRKHGHSDEDIESLLNKKHEIVKYSDEGVKDLIHGFYAMIIKILCDKYSCADWIVKRVYNKLSKYGLKKMLDLDNTLGR